MSARKPKISPQKERTYQIHERTSMNNSARPWRKSSFGRGGRGTYDIIHSFHATAEAGKLVLIWRPKSWYHKETRYSPRMAYSASCRGLQLADLPFDGILKTNKKDGGR